MTAPPDPGRPTPARLDRGWRDRAWARLAEGQFDVLVIGGGITGAGIARRAAQAGLRTALLEKGDLAAGTSSWSSKLVHGGLRYLAHLQVGVVRESVRGREALLRAAPGLVEELGFLMPVARGSSPGRVMMEGGLAAYDLLAHRRTHRRLRDGELELLAPRVRGTDLAAAFRYGDAWTDDARLVYRVAMDAAAAGAVLVTYAEVEELLLGPTGDVLGVRMVDRAPGAGGRSLEVRAAAVVNATGAWADRLRARVGGAARLRPLRGSHLLFPAWRFPVAQAVSYPHPFDGRPVFAYPWESVTLVGTTDVDHPEDPDAGTRISPAEADYLLAWACHVFPSLDLRATDVHATFAGVRPVIGSGKADPSAESRDHACWEESGLLTVTGGKLTTFDGIARDALATLRPRFAGRTLGAGHGGAAGAADADASGPGAGAAARDADTPPLDPLPEARAWMGSRAGAAIDDELALLPPGLRRRLRGRHGADASALVEAAADRDELAAIPGTPDPWAALRWAARAEGVVHLDDLLLRRVRLGLLLPGGGMAHLARIRSLVEAELDWDDARWEAEEAAYRARWARDHAPNAGAGTAEAGPLAEAGSLTGAVPPLAGPLAEAGAGSLGPLAGAGTPLAVAQLAEAGPA
jgi:glycerol-3-phosphate dehydrogenase